MESELGFEEQVELKVWEEEKRYLQRRSSTNKVMEGMLFLAVESGSKEAGLSGTGDAYSGKLA